MMTEQRRALLQVLDDFGHLYPEWRFGQLIANLSGIAEAEPGAAADQQLLKVAEEHLRHRLSVLRIERANLANHAQPTPPRDDIVAALQELSRFHPEWRLGQFVALVADEAGVNIYDIEDDQLLNVARQRLSEQQTLAPSP